MNNLFQYFSELISLTSDEQKTYLDNNVADEAIRKALESMLSEQAFDFTALFSEGMSLSGESISGNNLIGQRIGKYEITSMIGQGGMGSVFLASRADGEFEQRVAIKIIPKELFQQTSEQVLNHEAQSLAQLNHPNIVPIFDAGKTDQGMVYIVMRFLDGLPLNQYIKQNSLDDKSKLSLFIKLLDAVSHAHANQVLHRDIKPQNILVDEYGEPSLVDFGISSLIDEGSSPTNQSYLRAFSIGYASPEQKLADKITTASDVFSLGQVLNFIMAEQAPNTDIIDNNISEVIMAVISKATCENPIGRYETVAHFKQDIILFLQNKPTQAYDHKSHNIKLWFKRNKVGVVASAAIFTAITFSSIQIYNSTIEAQKQAILANSNLQLAENMLKQVDIKVVTEVERQRALVNSARSININLLPIEQAVRFTLSLAHAYKTIGDYTEWQDYTNKLVKLTDHNEQFQLESIIARKMQIELNVLNNNNKQTQEDIKALNDELSKLPSLSDNRLFLLLDWEVGSTTISNKELQKFFNLLIPNLNPLNTNQDVLLKHIKLIAMSNISKSEQLEAIEKLLEEAEKNISEISSKRWVSLIHDWYLMSTTQGKHTSMNINERLVNNAELLQSLFDSDHPSVYILAILAKQTSIINRFSLSDMINNIYGSIDTNKLPPLYQVNYFIIELSRSIQKNELGNAYDIMTKVYKDLPKYGENALNYYLQFTVFANKYGKQDIYLNHLPTLISHYKNKKNLGHAAYFNYALCSNSVNTQDTISNMHKTGIEACNQAMMFYKEHHGTGSNLYISALLSKLRHLTKLNDFYNIEPVLKEVLSRKKEISYPITEERYYIAVVKAYLALKNYNEAEKSLSQFEAVSSPNSFDKLLLKLQFLTETNNVKELTTVLSSSENVDCEMTSASSIESFTSYRQKLNIQPAEICKGKLYWEDTVKDSKVADAIYSSVEHFITAL